MQNKSYKFGDTEFTVEKNVLKIQNAWIPVAMYFEKLNAMYTAECDMSKVNEYKQRLENLNIKDKQDQSDILKPDLLPEVTAKIQSEIEKNKVEIDKINEEFANDSEAQEQQREYNRMLGYAIQSLITSYDVLKGFLDIYLIGDKSKLNYEDESILEFINEVISDFFLYRMQNKKG